MYPNDNPNPNMYGASPEPNATPSEPARPAEPGQGSPLWAEPSYQPVQPAGSVYSPGHYSADGYNQRNYTYAQPQKKQKKNGGFGIVKAICLILACAVIASAASAGTASLVFRYHLNQMNSMPDNRGGDIENSTHSSEPTVNQVVLGSRPSSSQISPSDVTVTGQALTAQEIYALAADQVVGINSSVTQNVFGQSTTRAVSGSGFVISDDGYIMTNFHVIEYTVRYGYDLKVLFKDGTSYPAEVVGYEKDNDVAVIKIDASGLHAVVFGDSDSIVVGEPVYAIGNPLGELDFSMTTGIVSALDREITTDIYTTINMFQIDAAVNHGNSGGPVYNDRGEVIGIVTAKYSDTGTVTGVEGLGFAIPINDAVYIAKQIIENGYVQGKAYLGIMAADASRVSAQYFGMPDGAYVDSVEDGSCAARAGVTVGDVITALDDHAVTSVDTLKKALRLYAPGDSAVLTVVRNGETLHLSVVFDEAPAPDLS